MAYTSLADYFRQQQLAGGGFYAPRYQGAIPWGKLGPTKYAMLKERNRQERQSTGKLRKHALKMGQKRVRRGRVR